MRYVVLACDYDGTLALRGQVDEPTLAALERVLASGRRLMLVTGRQLEDLQTVFPRLDLFERVVAENGGVVYAPASRQQRSLGEPPPTELVAALRQQGVSPLSVGRTIISTWEPHEMVVLETIRDLGLEYHLVFNKGAVMALPSGINKSTGLSAALEELGLSPHNVVGVGDGENDHAFLTICEAAVAVANAVPMLKRHADLVTSRDHGPGVVELIDQLVANDLRGIESRLWRHDPLLGRRQDDGEVRLKAFGARALLAGPSASGKSTLAMGLLERLAAQRYQYCLIDPEGDYGDIPHAVTLGDSDRIPGTDEVLDVMENPVENVVVNLLGLRLEDRPGYFASLLPRLQELQAQTGRPHWLVVDEAHHLLPATWEPASLVMPREFGGVLLITVHAQSVAHPVLSRINTVIAMGERADQTVRAFCQAVGQRAPSLSPTTLGPMEGLIWFKSDRAEPFIVRVQPPLAEHRRHVRKYAEGDLGPERSFYFHGPDRRLNLRAQNLAIFDQIAEGIDDETWLFHLRQGDYARWFRESIKDEELVAEAERAARDQSLSPQESRARIRAAIERRYSLPEHPATLSAHQSGQPHP